MNRQAQAVVMLLFGGAVVKASVTDMYLRYVKEGLRPFLIAAGVLLIAAAVMTLFYDLRKPAASGHDHDHGDGKPHREPRVGWFLILPVLGLLLVAPPALGSYAAGQAGTALSNQQQMSDYPPLPEGDPAPITVLDYASRAVFDKGASIGDRRVQLTGFIAQGADGQPILARIILSCCAADGRPIKVGMSGDAPSGLATDTWVEVVGTYTDRTATDPVNDDSIPFIEVESWRQIDPPKQQYE
ncbi:TIGR03943 family putative permease subunit [Micromonospora sp. CPCC 206061]|uniref:TIGR03943 family putative permease subunit n=1 Tax=Micromonospora sp. CPCC 206061 TaxID=3122410 RepID=UPI002FEEF598